MLPLHLLWLSTLLLAPALSARPKPCHPAAEAASYQGKDVCIAVRVYDVAQLRDGTRFLDTCSADTSDDECRFTIASLPEDTRRVGDLAALRGHDIEVRGVVHSVNGRGLMYLSDARQLHGGAEKFRPNPALLSGFSAEDGKPPVHDSALTRSSRHPSVFRTRH